MQCEYPDGSKHSALGEALRRNPPDKLIVQKLINRGADLDAQDVKTFLKDEKSSTEMIEVVRIGEYEKAVRDKNSYAALGSLEENLGKFYEKQGKYQQAIQWYGKALGHQRGNVLYALGKIYQDHLKDIPKAIECYARAGYLDYEYQNKAFEIKKLNELLKTLVVDEKQTNKATQNDEKSSSAIANQTDVIRNQYAAHLALVNLHLHINPSVERRRAIHCAREIFLKHFKSSEQDQALIDGLTIGQAYCDDPTFVYENPEIALNKQFGCFAFKAVIQISHAAKLGSRAAYHLLRQFEQSSNQYLKWVASHALLESVYNNPQHGCFDAEHSEQIANELKKYIDNPEYQAFSAFYGWGRNKSMLDTITHFNSAQSKDPHCHLLKAEAYLLLVETNDQTLKDALAAIYAAHDQYMVRNIFIPSLRFQLVGILKMTKSEGVIREYIRIVFNYYKDASKGGKFEENHVSLLLKDCILNRDPVIELIKKDPDILSALINLIRADFFIQNGIARELILQFLDALKAKLTDAVPACKAVTKAIADCHFDIHSKAHLSEAIGIYQTISDEKGLHNARMARIALCKKSDPTTAIADWVSINTIESLVQAAEIEYASEKFQDAIKHYRAAMEKVLRDKHDALMVLDSMQCMKLHVEERRQIEALAFSDAEFIHYAIHFSRRLRTEIKTRLQAFIARCGNSQAKYLAVIAENRLRFHEVKEDDKSRIMEDHVKQACPDALYYFANAFAENKRFFSSRTTNTRIALSLYITLLVTLQNPWIANALQPYLREQMVENAKKFIKDNDCLSHSKTYTVAIRDMLSKIESGNLFEVLNEKRDRTPILTIYSSPFEIVEAFLNQYEGKSAEKKGQNKKYAVAIKTFPGTPGAYHKISPDMLWPAEPMVLPSQAEAKAVVPDAKVAPAPSLSYAVVPQINPQERAEVKQVVNDIKLRQSSEPESKQMTSPVQQENHLQEIAAYQAEIPKATDKRRIEIENQIKNSIAKLSTQNDSPQKLQALMNAHLTLVFLKWENSNPQEWITAFKEAHAIYEKHFHHLPEMHELFGALNCFLIRLSDQRCLVDLINNHPNEVVNMQGSLLLNGIMRLGDAAQKGSQLAYLILTTFYLNHESMLLRLHASHVIKKVHANSTLTFIKPEFISAAEKHIKLDGTQSTLQGYFELYGLGRPENIPQAIIEFDKLINLADQKKYYNAAIAGLSCLIDARLKLQVLDQAMDDHRLIEVLHHHSELLHFDLLNDQQTIAILPLKFHDLAKRIKSQAVFEECIKVLKSCYLQLERSPKHGQHYRYSILLLQQGILNAPSIIEFLKKNLKCLQELLLVIKSVFEQQDKTKRNELLQFLLNLQKPFEMNSLPSLEVKKTLAHCYEMNDDLVEAQNLMRDIKSDPALLQAILLKQAVKDEKELKLTDARTHYLEAGSPVALFHAAQIEYRGNKIQDAFTHFKQAMEGALQNNDFKLVNQILDFLKGINPCFKKQKNEITLLAYSHSCYTAYAIPDSDRENFRCHLNAVSDEKTQDEQDIRSAKILLERIDFYQARDNKDEDKIKQSAANGCVDAFFHVAEDYAKQKSWWNKVEDIETAMTFYGLLLIALKNPWVSHSISDALMNKMTSTATQFIYSNYCKKMAPEYRLHWCELIDSLNQNTFIRTMEDATQQVRGNTMLSLQHSPFALADIYFTHVRKNGKVVNYFDRVLKRSWTNYYLMSAPAVPWRERAMHAMAGQTSREDSGTVSVASGPTAVNYVPLPAPTAPDPLEWDALRDDIEGNTSISPSIPPPAYTVEVEVEQGHLGSNHSVRLFKPLVVVSPSVSTPSARKVEEIDYSSREQSRKAPVAI